MRKVSLVVSLVGLGLMCLGFLGWLVGATSLLLPGSSVPSLSSLLRLQSTGLRLAAMSAGIVLLGLIPMIRVTLACWLYLRERDLRGAFIALIVLLELMLSIRLSV
ncbi:MAG: DUF1634 domain-containing protein [Nitrospirota bacterium]